jgi:hypothetical protein
MCAELKVPAPPEIFIRFQVHDKDGKLIFDDKQRGHSWTRNFYNWTFSQLTQGNSTGENAFGAGKITSKNIAGANGYIALRGAGISPSAAYFNGNYGIRAAVGSTDRGIVVGTSDTAFSADGYALGAIVASGTGSGQLSYQASPAPTLSYDSGTKVWSASIARVMFNGSGGSITIKETGLYWQGDGANVTFFSTDTAAYLVERSVLSPSVAVANGAMLTVTYEISMDFSAID